MKRKTFYRLVLAILFIVSVSSLVLADQKYDFRKTHWGMSKAQVKKTEKGKIVRDVETMLVYQGNVGGHDCLIGYMFAEGKLVRSKYLFTETHSNANDYIVDYDRLKKILIKKYGKPIEDTLLWKNDLYKDDYQHWGLAVSLGHLFYFADWKTPNTEITLALNGENLDVTLEIEYISRKLEKLEEKAKEKKALDEF